MSGIEQAVAQLALAHPGTVLPCPRCAASVKGANLDRHMTKVHTGRDPAAPPVGLSWRGPERLIARPLVLVPALAGAGGALWMWQSGNVNESVLLAAVGVLAVAVIVAAFVLRGSPLFHGRLKVVGDGLVLSHSLGLLRRRLQRVDPGRGQLGVPGRHHRRQLERLGRTTG